MYKNFNKISIHIRIEVKKKVKDWGKRGGEGGRLYKRKKSAGRRG